MKTNNIYDDPITFNNIYNVWKIVRKTCKNKRAVLNFALCENVNIMNIYYLLKTRKYKPGRFILFMIFEPKPRLVMSQSITDKIVNHFVANYYLIPYLEKKLINTNVATRKYKGTSYGLKYVEKYLNILNQNKYENIYCLKLDIEKYFYNIDHKILIQKLKKDIKDENVIDLIEKLLKETNKEYINDFVDIYNKNFKLDIPYYGENIGLSIGAQANQFLAIYFLNEIDHFAKEKLKCKYYIRYQDDIVIFDYNKEKLLYVWKKIEEKIKEINLKLNKKSNLFNMKNGISFLGYNYKIINHKLIINYRKKTYKRINRKLNYLYKNDKVKYYRSLASYNGYFKKIKKVERRFHMKLEEKYDYYKQKYPNYIIIIKDGSFYKTIKQDALIMWQIFGYKWHNETISFGNSPYHKVLNELNRIGINYIIAENVERIVKNNDEVYDLILTLANINYDKYKKYSEMETLVKDLLDKDLKNYNKLKKYIEKELAV